MRTVHVLVLAALAALAFVPAATADCSTISRSQTVPAEGAVASASILQCADSYASGTYQQQSTYNDTSAHANDATTGGFLLVDDQSSYYTQSDSSYSYADHQIAHSYVVGAGAQGATVFVAVGASQYEWVSGTQSGCFGGLGFQVSHYDAVENGYTADGIPWGSGSQLACPDDATLDSLP